MAKTTKTRAADPARKLAIEAARLAQNDNAQDILVLDLRGVSPVTDYFVICTGTSGRQMRAVADDIMAYAAAENQPVWHAAGLEGGQWVCLDFVDVVVHIFDQERRRYYDLELIWGEAPRVRWQRSTRTPKQPTE
jgi:ribosome-associated protein